MSESMDTISDPLGVLARIRETRRRPAAEQEERCDLCTEPIGPEHGHLVDLQARSLMCACRGCQLLFTVDGAGGSRYRAVPDRYLALPALELSSGQWESLQIPVSVAFFFYNSSLERTAAFYPGPAGATESLLPLEAWAELTAADKDLASLQPDVEAWLVRSQERAGGGAESFIVPIDACYELVGRLRRLWRGFDGGREAQAALDEFFDGVRAKAGVAP
jgi:Family of unknown function (DUF5947)